MSTIPLPHAAIVQSIQSVQPFAPGDILMIQSATTQANIPVLVLGINKLDPTQFILDTSTDPDTVKIKTGVGGITDDPAWTQFVPTVIVQAGTPTNTTLVARYLQKGKTVYYSLYWSGQISAVTNLAFRGFPVAKVAAGGYVGMPIAMQSGGVFINGVSAFMQNADLNIVAVTAPFVIATNLVITSTGTYEAV